LSSRDAVVAPAHRPEHYDPDGADRTDKPETCLGSAQRNERQRHRSDHGADLIAGLPDGKDQRTLLRRASRQSRAGRRLRSECKADEQPGDEQGKAAADTRHGHAAHHRERAQCRDPAWADPARELPAIERRRHADGAEGCREELTSQRQSPVSAPARPARTAPARRAPQRRRREAGHNEGISDRRRPDAFAIMRAHQ
jgi:hypothetical protein